MLILLIILDIDIRIQPIAKVHNMKHYSKPFVEVYTFHLVELLLELVRGQTRVLRPDCHAYWHRHPDHKEIRTNLNNRAYRVRS